MTIYTCPKCCFMQQQSRRQESLALSLSFLTLPNRFAGDIFDSKCLCGTENNFYYFPAQSGFAICLFIDSHLIHFSLLFFFFISKIGFTWFTRLLTSSDHCLTTTVCIYRLEPPGVILCLHFSLPHFTLEQTI